MTFTEFEGISRNNQNINLGHTLPSKHTVGIVDTNVQKPSMEVSEKANPHD